MASDVDGDGLSYSISGGFNSSLFTIDASTGALRFISAPNYENPQACGNNYDVVVSVSDGTLTDTQDIHVMVTDVPEGLPPAAFVIAAADLDFVTLIGVSPMAVGDAA